MSTLNYGGVPGTNTPNEKAPGAANSKGLMTYTNASDFNSKIIAACAKIKGAATGFYLDRGIGADTILMAVLALIYGGWRAFQ